MPELDKVMPGQGTTQTVVNTADSATHAVNGAATAMDNTQSREKQVEGQKEAIEGGGKTGSTAVGAVIGTKLGGNTAMGAQVGNMVGETVAPMVSKIAQPMLDPVFQAGGKLNDEIQQKTGINTAGTVRQVSGVAAQGTEALKGVSDGGGNDLMGKLGNVTTELNQGGKTSAVDTKALLKPQPHITPQAEEKLEHSSPLKQVASGLGKNGPEAPRPENAQLDKLKGTSKEGATTAESDKSNKTKLR